MTNDCYGVELHMHLDGCVPAKVIWNSAERRGKLEQLKKASNASSVQELWNWISVDDSCASLKALLDDMNNYFEYIVDDEQALRELCHYAVRYQFKNKVYYTETRYCPHLLCDKILTPSKVVEIISDELNKRSKEYGIIIKQILCCMRQWLNKLDKDNKNKTLNDMLIKPREIIQIASKYRDLGYGIVGVDLAGNESESSSKDGYNIIFNEAKNLYNLHITIHAGEANNINYKSIYDAIENMNAERIGHGYKTIDSLQLVADLSLSNLDIKTLEEESKTSSNNTSDDTNSDTLNNNNKSNSSIISNSNSSSTITESFENNTNNNSNNSISTSDSETSEKTEIKETTNTNTANISSISNDNSDAMLTSGKYSHIHLECCPTSSIITNSVNGIALLSRDYRNHPIRYFNDKNINYSISTDDPQVLRCSYQGQLSIAHYRMDISIKDIKKSILRAAKYSFLDGKEKELLINEIKLRLNKYFKILKAKNYHNDSLSKIDRNNIHRYINHRKGRRDSFNSYNSNIDTIDESTEITDEDEERIGKLKYIAIGIIIGMASLVLYQKRKKQQR